MTKSNAEQSPCYWGLLVSLSEIEIEVFCTYVVLMRHLGFPLFFSFEIIANVVC